MASSFVWSCRYTLLFCHTRKSCTFPLLFSTIHKWQCIGIHEPALAYNTIFKMCFQLKMDKFNDFEWLVLFSSFVITCTAMVLTTSLSELDRLVLFLLAGVSSTHSPWSLLVFKHLQGISCPQVWPSSTTRMSQHTYRLFILIFALIAIIICVTFIIQTTTASLYSHVVLMNMSSVEQVAHKDSIHVSS